MKEIEQEGGAALPVIADVLNDAQIRAARVFFFFNDTATTEIYTFPTRRSSDLPATSHPPTRQPVCRTQRDRRMGVRPPRDRKSTRLNSSHLVISYAVFCLKKKKKNTSKHSSLKYIHY